MSVMLTCRDMKRSLPFYRDVLGFAVKECWPDEQEPMWANLMRHGQSIMLGQAVDAADPACHADDPQAAALHRALAEEFAENHPGAGVMVYLLEPDLDAYHAEVTGRGAEADTAPKDQFYGIRDFHLRDPDGYRLAFHHPITLTSCQSCGMPLADAVPGQMYCGYCTDEKGQLRPYEEILEGTITGFFMGMQKMTREQAEPAAKAHLASMPAWQIPTAKS